MSDVSSEAVLPPARTTLPGWLIALIALTGTAFLFFLAELGGGLIVALIAFVAHLPERTLDSTVWVEALYSVLADGLLLGGVYLLLRRLGWSLQTIGFVRPQVRQVLTGILLVVPYYITYLCLAGLIKVLVPALNFDQKQELGFDNVQGLVPLAMTFVTLVVLPPLAEETVMRGFMFTGLKRLFPWGVAGLIVSLLFGAAHLTEGGASGPLWIGAIDTFTLSLFLIVLRQKTGNLWPGIALHATKNLVAFALLFIVGQ